MPPRPRTRGLGRKNRPTDEAFIEEHASEMRFNTHGLLVWSGKAEDIGSEFQIPDDENRCVRKFQVLDNDGRPVLDVDEAPLMRRCERWVMRRTGLCSTCAGGSAAVQRAVRERISGAADAIAGDLIEMALDRTVDASTRLKALNSLLDRFGIRAGIELSPDVPKWTQVLETMMNGGDDDADAGTEGG